MNLMQAHNQWANRPQDERFESLDSLRQAVHNRRMKSRSIDVDCGKTHIVSENNLLTINGTLTPCEPTHWSFGQLSSLVKAPGGYLRTLPQPLIVDCLNHGLQQSGRESVKFMTVERDNGNLLQAVTSTTYGRIWDADVVDATSRIVERTGGKFYNPKAYDLTSGSQKPSGLYASDRDVFMFMIDGGSLLDAGPRAQLNRGFIVWNSEVGARTFGLMTFLFNTVCGNHIIWGAQDINKLVIRHTLNGPARFDGEATPALLAYTNATAAPMEAVIRKAQSMLLGDKREDVAQWLNSNGKFSRSEISSAIDFAKSEEGDCRTLWQVIQGGTAYARGFDYIDARIDLETRFGKLLNLAV
jgi:hypothetical protein